MRGVLFDVYGTPLISAAGDIGAGAASPREHGPRAKHDPRGTHHSVRRRDPRRQVT